MSANCSALGSGITAQSAKHAIPSSNKALSGLSIKNVLDKVFIPCFNPIKNKAALNISPVA